MVTLKMLPLLSSKTVLAVLLPFPVLTYEHTFLLKSSLKIVSLDFMFAARLNEKKEKYRYLREITGRRTGENNISMIMTNLYCYMRQICHIESTKI